MTVEEGEESECFVEGAAVGACCGGAHFGGAGLGVVGPAHPGGAEGFVVAVGFEGGFGGGELCVGAVEGVAENDRLPGEGRDGHVSGFGEGVACDEAFVKDVEVVGHLEEGLEDIADGGSGAFVEERANPVGV